MVGFRIKFISISGVSQKRDKKSIFSLELELCKDIELYSGA